MESEGTATALIDQKEAFWRRTLETWKDSRLSGSEFQRRNNLTQNAFVYWKRKLMPRRESAQTLVPVSVRTARRGCPVAAPRSLRLNIGSLYTVEVTVGFDAQTLREVLAVVRDYAR
jgi:hypothetical protein